MTELPLAAQSAKSNAFPAKHCMQQDQKKKHAAHADVLLQSVICTLKNFWMNVTMHKAWKSDATCISAQIDNETQLS